MSELPDMMGDFAEGVDDEFWNQSSNRNTGFFDEDLTTTMRVDKGSVSVSRIQPDVNFDGSPAAPKPATAMSKRPPEATVASRRHQASESEGAPVPKASLGHSRSSSLGVGMESSLSANITRTTPATAPAPNRPPPKFLERDLQKMTLKVQHLEDKVVSKLPVGETIKRMLTGQPYCLEPYKSLEDKVKLLNEAIATHDGNSITAAVLFLKKTVKNSLFHRELITRPQAISHYLAYLRAHYDHQELVETLSRLGRNEEAAVFRYKMACQTSDPRRRVGELKNCIGSYFITDPSLSAAAALLRQHVALLERQMPVETADRAKKASGGEIMTGSVSLVGQPVLTTLFYCCKHYYGLTENNLASPEAIRKAHNLSEKQFMWIALSALAMLKKWGDIEPLFQTKGWLGGKKMKQVLNFAHVVELLHNREAPVEVLSAYLVHVENLDSRLSLAQKFNCYRVAVDVLVAQRDRSALEAYAHKLQPYSAQKRYADNALASSTIKWKR